jgi:hypothetical protein
MKIINRHRQEGVTGVAWLAIIGIAILIIGTFLKVFPMYYENYQIKSVLLSIQEDPSIDVKSKRAIWTTMNKRLYINGVKSIKREHVKMSRKEGKTTINVTYETRDSYFGNLFIGGNFNESIVIDR